MDWFNEETSRVVVSVGGYVLAALGALAATYRYMSKSSRDTRNATATSSLFKAAAEFREALDIDAQLNELRDENRHLKHRLDQVFKAIMVHLSWDVKLVESYESLAEIVRQETNRDIKPWPEPPSLLDFLKDPGTSPGDTN